MLKIKNILFWSFVTLALAGAVYAYFAIKQSKKPQVEALAVMPDSCLVYLNTDNFFELNNKIRSQSLIADKLKLFTEINALCEQLQLFDSLFASNESLKEEIDDNLIHFGIYNNPSQWLASFNIKQLGDQATIKETLNKLLNATSDKNNISSFTMGKDLHLYFHLDAGIVCISNTSDLIASAIDKKRPKFFNSVSYKEFNSTLAENKLLSVYINHGLYTRSKLNNKINLAGFCKKGFSAGQIELEPSGLKVNGFMNPDSSEVIYALMNQESQSPNDMLGILPYNVRYFKSFGFGYYKSFVSKIAHLTKTTHAEFWKKSNEVSMYNLSAEFADNIKNHLLEFETAVATKAFVAVEVGDTVKALEHLKFMSDTVYTSNLNRIFRLREESAELKLFVPLLNTTTKFCSVFNSFILLSSSAEDLQTLLNNLNNQQLATSNESFNYYRSQHFPDNYNFLLYASPNGNRKSIESFFNFKLSGNKDPFENFRHFSYSLVNDAKAFKFRMQLLNEAESNARQENVLWTLRLDTFTNMKPASFVNHVNGENEIVIQDAANTLYLISAKGDVVWKKNIGEKILSEIYKVDALGNNKFQMLFNTKNHIYLIDRNGNPVKGFPIDLPSEATSPLSLIQYINDKDKDTPKDKDLRLFIACSDNAIYNYNMHGAAPEGFVPVKTEHEVNLTLQYVKVGKSDYLVALDREGKIYTFSRKGEARIGLKNRTLANCSAFYIDAGNSVDNTFLICVDDKSGLINKIKFSDEKELIKVNMEHGSAGIQFSLIDDNRDMDIVITLNNNIQAFNFHGDLLFEKNLNTSLSEAVYYSDESHALYYGINVDKTELVLFDPGKQKVKKIKGCAMPLVTPLFNDNKKYLVVSNGNQLSCLPLE